MHSWKKTQIPPPPLRKPHAVQISLKTVQISAFYNKNHLLRSQVCFGETTTFFQIIYPRPAALQGVQQLGFLFMQSNKCCSLTGEIQKFPSLREGRRSLTISLCPNNHSMIRFKPLDLLRPTSNKTPPTWSKYHFKSRSFLKCLLPPQQPRMVQPPPKFLPIYYHKRLPWNLLGRLPFVRGAECFC